MTVSQRYMSHLPPVIIAGRTIKRYHLTIDNTPIPQHIQDAAYRYLPTLLPDYPDNTPPATVSVLHQGDNAVHLHAYSWIADHVVDCRAATADHHNPTGFTPHDTPRNGYLWELPALVHERAAWAKHMLQTDAPDFGHYLADVPTGVPIAG